MIAPSPAEARRQAEANAWRNGLLLNKLDPSTAWVQNRHPVAGGHAITVERRGEDIVKTLRGFMAQLQDHELNAYLAVWKTRQALPRIATFRRLEGRDSDLAHNTLILRDYGPDLLDWLRLSGPPRLDCQDTGRPARDQPLGPWLRAEALLALARALLEALHPFHRAGFVHCDLKLDNICIRQRLAPTQRIGLDAPVTGEIDLDSFIVIDLGCALLPSGGSYRRVIHHTQEGQPLYIGGTPSKRLDYTWPALFGAADEVQARAQAPKRLDGSAAPAGTRPEKPREIAYISDHYLLCCELAELGHKDALDRLDWRIDFHSLGHLLQSLLRQLGRDRRIEAANPAQLPFLERLPARLMAHDTSPFTAAPAPPHAELIAEIDALIGPDQYRRLPFTVLGNANPMPWFDMLPDTPFTELAPALPQGAETPLREARQGPGQPFAEFRDFSEAPPLIALPAAQAILGSPLDEPGRAGDEPVPHRIDIAPYALGKYPVSFAEWDAFLRATGRPPPEGQDQGWGRGNRPVIQIDPRDIAAYLDWLNQIGGWAAEDPHRYRLPTAQEWECAARANTRTAYFTGAALAPEQAHYYLRPAPADLPPRDRTAPVGSFPANPWGFHDLLGNVWEYARDGGTGLVLRGGSWLNGPAFLRAAARQTPPAGGRGAHIGFRVARSLGRRG